MAKARLWTGPRKVLKHLNWILAGPSGIKIKVFITAQAPERFRIVSDFWSRYDLFIKYHKYTDFQNGSRGACSGRIAFWPDPAA